MKIIHTDGSISETDRMNDFSADLLEQTKVFTDFMCARKVPFVLRFYDPVKKCFCGAGNANDSIEDTSRILHAIDMYTRPMGYGLAPVEDET